MSHYLDQVTVIALAIEIFWNILPRAIDRALAGELGWGEIPGYTLYALSLEAQADEERGADATADYQIIPERDVPLMQAANWKFSTEADARELCDKAAAAIRSKPQ